MAGIGKYKIGAELRFKDNLGEPLKCGDCVRNSITGKEGIITQYGVVKGVDGTNYKLCDGVWEVIEKKEEPVDLNIGEMESEADDIIEINIPHQKEKTLADFSDDEILAEIGRRNFGADRLEQVGVRPFKVEEFEDKNLANELRKRGYEVKAEKTVVVCL